MNKVSITIVLLVSIALSVCVGSVVYRYHSTMNQIEELVEIPLEVVEPLKGKAKEAVKQIDGKELGEKAQEAAVGWLEKFNE